MKVSTVTRQWECLLVNKSQLSQGREIWRYWVKKSMPICLKSFWNIFFQMFRAGMLFFSGGNHWKVKGKGILFNVGGQTGKDCLLTWADGVKVADRRDRTRNLLLRERCTDHWTTGPHTKKSIQARNVWKNIFQTFSVFCTQENGHWLFHPLQLQDFFLSFHPLSAIWRIYSSSKWSSQWSYDGHIRHGWMTSWESGRDSATPECFVRGSQGTIFVRSSKISLFFPELCSFGRVFCFPRFCKTWHQTFECWSFGFDDALELFWKLRSVTAGHLFANTDDDLEYFLKTTFLFIKAEPVLLAWQLC